MEVDTPRCPGRTDGPARGVRVSRKDTNPVCTGRIPRLLVNSSRDLTPEFRSNGDTSQLLFGFHPSDLDRCQVRFSRSL